VKEGDQVAVYGGWGDGFCDYCVAGEENLCPTMQWVGLSQHEGGDAEYLLVATTVSRKAEHFRAQGGGAAH